MKSPLLLLLLLNRSITNSTLDVLNSLPMPVHAVQCQDSPECLQSCSASSCNSWHELGQLSILHPSGKKNPLDHKRPLPRGRRTAFLKQFDDHSAQETSDTHTVVDKNTAHWKCRSSCKGVERQKYGLTAGGARLSSQRLNSQCENPAIKKTSKTGEVHWKIAQSSNHWMNITFFL